MKKLGTGIAYILLFLIVIIDIVLLYIIVTPIEDIEQGRRVALFNTCETERCKDFYGGSNGR